MTKPAPEITVSAAHVLRAMVANPRKDHWIPDLEAETGLARGTIRNTIRRLDEAGWIATKTGEHIRGRHPNTYYRLTREGLTAARKELKAWTFTPSDS